MTRADRWKQRKCVVKYWHFKDKLKGLFKANDIVIKDELYIEFGLPMPKSWSKKKKKEHNSQFHNKRPDIDNLLKSVLDALFEEDSHVHSVKARKLWSDEPYIIIMDSQEF
jgi:Holliday junction resolvase RusA-like endonuclease